MSNLLLTTGLIFNIQRFSVHDGPGIRTTLFFKGCSLQCAWCHNPESISPHPEMMLRSDLCLNCGACIAACPQEAIAATPAGPVTERKKCIACGHCAKACPVDARVQVGGEMTVAEVLQTVLADRVFYDQSGGGVSFSGGEPTRQPDFLHALLEASRDEGLHTVVDTCGYAPWPVFARIAKLTDLFLFDLKMIDPEKHRHWTGVSNRRILENLTRLDAEGSAVSLRMPVIPGINDNPEDLDKMADWLGTLRHVQTLHLLPFHRGGTEKYLRLDRPCHLRKIDPPDMAQMEKMAGRFRNHIANVFIGG
jgi:pyruvate formate lyase activating enzyme